MKKYLITSALPYANGALHFGHLAGAYLPADVFCRHKKLLGHQALHISGSDEHGVAITLSAQKAGVPYKEYVDGWHQSHKELFDAFKVEFSFFGQTSADYHHREATRWFKDLHEKGMITPQDDEMLKCQDCHNFLPDRYVEGECYECGYEKARGDECPACGIWIEPTKLKSPQCKICDSKNIETAISTQYYLMLSKKFDEFRKWFATKDGKWRKTVFPFVDSLTKEGLHDRAISRDLDWGVKLPLKEADAKRMYVWFDAPIGYISNTIEYCKNSGEDAFKDWWNNSDTEIYNFIGKDNIIFHSVIFPVMSMTTGMVRPVDQVPANQYLNLEGQQFSKSAGHDVDAKGAVEEFGSDALRYYLLSILPEASDSSFSWEQFLARANNELANNIGNLVSRCLKFWFKNWPDGLTDEALSKALAHELTTVSGKKALGDVHEALDNVDIRKALERVMSYGQEVNTFFSDNAPWAVYKTDQVKASEIIATTSVAIMNLAAMLSPFLPELSFNMASVVAPGQEDEMLASLYKGDLSSLTALFTGGHALKAGPNALVPKIDAKRTEKFPVNKL